MITPPEPPCARIIRRELLSAFDRIAVLSARQHVSSVQLLPLLHASLCSLAAITERWMRDGMPPVTDVDATVRRLTELDRLMDLGEESGGTV